MSSWVQPYMEYEPVEEEEFNAEDFEEAIDAMSQNIDNILETASANIGIDITLLSFIVSAIASVVGFCIYKWKPEVVTCCDIECASETETVAGSSAPVNAEVIELTNVGTKQKGAKEPEIANARELTDDEFLNRPETPSASVSLLTEVTPKRKRTPIARSISSSSATPGPSTPPIKPRIVKSRVPPYRSLANKNRKTPVHNKRIPTPEIDILEKNLPWTSADEMAASPLPHLQGQVSDQLSSGNSAQQNLENLNELPSLDCTPEHLDTVNFNLKRQLDEASEGLPLADQDRSKIPIRQSGRKRMPPNFYKPGQPSIKPEKSSIFSINKPEHFLFLSNFFLQSLSTSFHLIKSLIQKTHHFRSSLSLYPLPYFWHLFMT
ncbi:unnamed protein product [Oikopleura dioica]|uniref:Uncharacterized protein n=1 Tax=Oikopleura dioica TaxID=34765 RepID=E4XZF0_OIKDI|nr:unnamed protein product [Oikopleura dioica]